MKIDSDRRIIAISEISQAYLRGEISYEKHKELKTKYDLDYYKIIVEKNSIPVFVTTWITKLLDFIFDSC